MKVTLIYPPCDMLNCEAFTIPNLALPVLAYSLREAGHEPVIADLDIICHGAFRRGDPALALLRHPKKTEDLLKGRLKGRDAALLAAFAERLLRDGRIGPSGLYAITMAGFKMSPLLVNAAALTAWALKKSFGAPVIVGHRMVPRQLFVEMMTRFPVFDYAAYQAGGPQLARLADRLSGRASGPVLGVLERKGSRLADRPFTEVSALKSEYTRQADYSGYPLASYALDASALYSRYNPDTLFGPDLVRRAGKKKQLLAMYRFSETCRGACAFCGNDRAFSASLNTDQVIEDLGRMKEAGVTGVYFINPNFNDRYDFAAELCGKMIKKKLGLLWCDCVNAREMDAKLLGLMRKSGAVKLTWGMETGSARLLRYIRKGTTPERISSCLTEADRLGIWNHIELIGGLPTETDDDLAETVSFLRRHAGVVDAYSINPFFLYPSAPFFVSAARFGLRVRRRPARVDHFSADESGGNFSERFDEVGGLKFEEKDAQIRRSTSLLARTVEELSPPCGIDAEHIHLLMALYSSLGHARKPLIRRIVRLLSMKFKPYYLDKFISPGFNKQNYNRVLLEKPAAGPRGAAR